MDCKVRSDQMCLLITNIFYFLSDDPYFYLQFLPAAERPPSFFSLDTDGRVVRLQNKLYKQSRKPKLCKIQCSGPMTFWCGSGSGSANHASDKWIRMRIRILLFRHWPSRPQQKTNLKTKIFCLLLFEGTFLSFFEDEKVKRSHNTVGIQVFLTIFAWW